MEVNVGVSNHHVHLTKETWISLFGDKPMIKRNDLSQKGEFATIETVALENNNKILEHVRIVGPFRNYDQVEISKSDANYLEVFPPSRQSGDLKDTPGITLIGPCGKVTLNSGVIIAENHIHMNPRMSSSLGLSNKQILYVYNNQDFLFEAKLKVSDNGVLELHVDRDQSKLYNLEAGSKVDFKVCGK